MPNLQQSKANRIKVLDSFPSNRIGVEGDIVISKIPGKGLFLCTKVGQNWFAANKLNALERLKNPKMQDLTLDSLNVDSLNINKALNAEEDIDKFLVSDKNRVKYKTTNQVLDNLSVFTNNVNYKNAYCSLGQYSNKEDCKANGGTWYYSDNDSHDSISSVAENQLLTVGQSIGTMDAEPTLLYDGSTLEIKRNTYFDDNWQTSVQTELLKLSYDSDNFGAIGLNSSGNMTFTVEEGNSFAFYERQTNGSIGFRMEINADDGILKLINPANVLDYFSIDIDDNAVTTIKTYDTGSTVGHLTLVPDGDLVLDPASQKTIINATDGLYFDSGIHTYIAESGDDNLRFTVGGTIMLDITEATGNSFNIQNSDATIDAAKKLIFDGSVLGHTYITESGDDVLSFLVGSKSMLILDESSDTITISAANWVAKIGAGSATEFSAANSAYAGMILGYTDIGLNEAHATLSLTTSYVVPTDEFSVEFTAPPSGNVSIEVQIQHYIGSSGVGDLHVGLSSANATSGYSALASYHEFQINDIGTRGGIEVVNTSWTLTGLTAGSDYEYWAGFKATSTSGTPRIQWGGSSAGRYADFIMKATALPATIAT